MYRRAVLRDQVDAVMMFRVFIQLRGEHYRWRIFVAPGRDRTFAGIGELTMRLPESILLTTALRFGCEHSNGKVNIEFIDEDSGLRL